MFLLYHAYVYLEFLILACTIYILAPVFNSLQFIIGIIGRIVSGLFTTYIVRLVDKLTQK